MIGVNNQDMFRQSYTRGLVVFFYGIVWLVALLTGYLLIDQLFPASGGLAMTLVVATCSSALAGGIGGATAMLSRLYQHMSIKQDFQRQSLLLYFVQPVTGLIVGVITLYLITIPGTLVVNFAINPNVSFGDVLVSSTFIATQILLSWIAGFHQQLGLEKIKSITQRFSKKATNGQDEQLETATASVSMDEDSPFFFKAWAYQQQQMIRWSYSWGIFIFLYGVAWFVGLVASFFLAGQWFSVLDSSGQATATALIMAAWPTAAAGGVGGVASLFHDLYRHVSIKQDFHRQHLMAYLVQPIIGFVFGLVIYFFMASGYLSIKSVLSEEAPNVVDAPTVIMAQLVLGWIAGFRQQTIADLIQQIIQHIVTLVKLIGVFLHPKNLFNKARRDKKLAEIGKQTALFKPVDRGSAPSSGVKWWMPD